MIYLVAYDIEENKQRNKVSNLLEKYGIRVQKSLFECNLDENSYSELIETLDRIIKKDANIRIYPLCKSCFSKAIGKGEVKIYPGLRGYEII